MSISYFTSAVCNEVFNSIISLSIKNNMERKKSYYDDMSLEEKTKILITDDKEQWGKFRELLITEGALTNISVKHKLFEFLKEREKISRVEEEIENNNKIEEQQRQREINGRKLKESLQQLGDSARSFKDQLIDSFQDEQIFSEPDRDHKNIISSKAA